MAAIKRYFHRLSQNTLNSNIGTPSWWASGLVISAMIIAAVVALVYLVTAIVWVLSIIPTFTVILLGALVTILILVVAGS